MKEGGIAVFYDEFEKARLLGKDLYQYLFEVYSNRAEYCIVIVSKEYATSRWPLHELKAIQARALQSGTEYLLPLRIDDTAIPGLPPQVGYLDLGREDIDTVVRILNEKLKGEGGF